MTPDSRGPTRISQPVSSSSLPLITATYPGMISLRCLTILSRFTALMALATTFSLSLSPEYAVRTLVPSVSTHRIQAGMRLASTSLSTV